MIETVDELIQALGGTTAAKEAFKVKSLSVVANWKAANRIPAKHHYKGRELCQKRGVKVRAKFWEAMV